MIFKIDTRRTAWITRSQKTYVVGFAVFSKQVDRLLLAVFRSEIARAEKSFHVRPELVTSVSGIASGVVLFAVVRRFRFVRIRRHDEVRKRKLARNNENTRVKWVYENWKFAGTL